MMWAPLNSLRRQVKWFGHHSTVWVVR